MNFFIRTVFDKMVEMKMIFTSLENVSARIFCQARFECNPISVKLRDLAKHACFVQTH